MIASTATPARDPFERDNIYARLRRAAKARLHALLMALTSCHGAGAQSCWRAERPRVIRAF